MPEVLYTSIPFVTGMVATLGSCLGFWFLVSPSLRDFGLDQRLIGQVLYYLSTAIDATVISNFRRDTKYLPGA